MWLLRPDLYSCQLLVFIKVGEHLQSKYWKKLNYIHSFCLYNLKMLKRWKRYLGALNLEASSAKSQSGNLLSFITIPIRASMFFATDWWTDGRRSKQTGKWSETLQNRIRARIEVKYSNLQQVFLSETHLLIKPKYACAARNNRRTKLFTNNDDPVVRCKSGGGRCVNVVGDQPVEVGVRACS